MPPVAPDDNGYILVTSVIGCKKTLGLLPQPKSAILCKKKYSALMVKSCLKYCTCKIILEAI